MKRGFLLLVLTLAASVLVNAQSAPAQNARQALLEMLFGKPGSFERHLPKTTIAAITKASNGGPSMLGQFSMLSTFANAPGSHLQTFEAGSTLLSFSDDRTQSKFEVTVESDDLRGDEDEIQLSFQGSKDGQPVARPLMPTLSLLMKQEAGIWKLNTISLTMRFPLADPEFLKAMATMSQQRATGIGAIAQPSAGPGTSVQSRPMEASAIASLRAIVTAETTYANTYPARGFTCTLSDLDGFGADSPNEHQAMLIESRLASGKKAGYIFQLSGCTGSPSAHFQVTAVPATPGMGARAFCADQSAILRSSTDGLAASCTTNGTPLQ